MEEISLKPTPEGYARSLILILTRSTSSADKEWAASQVIQYVKFYAGHYPEYFHQEEGHAGSKVQF